MEMEHQSKLNQIREFNAVKTKQAAWATHRLNRLSFPKARRDIQPDTMSNDVQVARVARITSDVMRRQGKQLSQQRDIKGISKGGGGVMGDDIEFVFGSISPRGGGPSVCLGQQKHVVGSYELDSPEHTQRDTTESDNNISSCSTLDIVNKVSSIYVYMYIYTQICMYMHIYIYTYVVCMAV